MTDRVLDLSVTGKTAVPLALAGFVLLGFALMVVAGPMAGWSIAIAGLTAILLLNKPSMLLLVYWSWCAVENLIEILYSPGIFRLFDEMLTGLMVVVCVGEYILNRRFDPVIRPMSRSLVAIALLFFVSAVVNNVKPLPAGHFASTYFSFYFVFFVAYFYLNEKHTRSYLRLILALFFLQVALNAGWQLGLNPIPNFRWGTQDFAIGSFGSCDVVAYYTIFVMMFCFPLYCAARNLFSKLCILALFGIAGLQLFITFTNHAYILLALALGLQFLMIKKQTRLKIQAVIMLGALCLMVLALSASSLGRSYSMFGPLEALAPDNLALRFNAMISGPKGQIFRNVVFEAPQNAVMPIIGAGPGNFASSIGAQYRSVLAEQHVNYVFLDYSGRVQMIGSSISQVVTTGFIAIWSELGAIGFVLFFGIHIFAVHRIYDQYRKGLYRMPERRILAEALVPVIPVYLLLNFMTDTFPLDLLTGGLWLCIAILWRPDPPVTSEQAIKAPSIRKSVGGYLAHRSRKPESGPSAPPRLT